MNHLFIIKLSYKNIGVEHLHDDILNFIGNDDISSIAMASTSNL